MKNKWIKNKFIKVNGHWIHESLIEYYYKLIKGISDK
jgi:hypothetical protein